MPTITTPLESLRGPGGPRNGFTQTTPKLLNDADRKRLGLPPASTVNAPKKKESLDGTPNGLGKDDFMKLLLAQMTNQDPLKPLEDKEFIAQLAQFNTLEQAQNMNKVLQDMLASQSISQASALLGKEIEAGSVKGAVTAVTMVNGKPRLTVGGTQVALADVTKVLPAAARADGSEETDTTSEDAVAAP